MKDTIYYLSGLALIFLGFFIPPLGGYEQIPIILGSLIVAKRIRREVGT